MRCELKKRIILILTILAVAFVFILSSCDKNENKNSNPIEYNIEIEYTENQVKGNQTVIFENNYADNLSKLCFNLYPNAYSENAKHPSFESELKSYGGIDIEGVNIDGITSANFSVNENKNLLIVETEPYEIGQEIKIEISYIVTLPECNLRMGFTGDNVRLANFYPQLAFFEDGNFRDDNFSTVGDPFLSECANYKVCLTVPSGYVVASSGSVINSVKNDDKQVINLAADKIRDFAIVLDKNYQVKDILWQNKEIKYYHYGDENAEKTLKIITDALTVYSEIYGEYVYPSLSVVMTDFADGGMEYGRLVYISTDDDDLETTIVHEIAHQWWYSMVGTDSINSPFIDEGLATFSSLLYYKSVYGESEYEKILNSISDSYSLYEKLQNMRQTGVSLELDKSIYDYTDYQYQMLIYKKSAMMFGHIYEIMGETKFKKAMQDFVENNRYKIAGLDELTECLNNGYGDDIGGVIRGWQSAAVYNWE